MLVWGFEDDTPRKDIFEALDALLEKIPLEAKDTHARKKQTLE